MARAATAGELAKFRSNGQWGKLHLIIDEPGVVYSARSTGTINETDWSIGFDGGSGTLGNCLADMTLLVGSSAGKGDKAIARLRKAPAAGTFYIGLDPSLTAIVANDDYLTVVDDFELWAIHANGTNLDVDLAYSDQFSSWLPIPVMGDAWVIEAGDTITPDGSESYVRGSTISGYAWTASGATTTSDMNTATPSMTYETSGRYRITLTVTAANGKSYAGHRMVYVLGDNLAPESGTVIGEPECDENGLWSVDVLMYDRPTIENLRRAVVYAEEWYGGVAGSIGPYAGSENIVMQGWVIGESIVRTPGMDVVEFRIGNTLETARLIACQQTGLTDSAFPTDEELPAWAKCTGLTAAKMINYMITLRSTLARVVDVRVEDWGFACAHLEGESERLAEQLVDVANSAVLCVRSDRYGRIYIERDTQLYPVASRGSIPIVMALTDGDWKEEMTVIRRQAGGGAQAKAEGYIYSNKKETQVGGIAPGVQPARTGDTAAIDDIYFGTKGDALQIAGLMAGALNQEIETILVELAGNVRLVDAAPRQLVTVTVDGVDYDCIPRAVRLRMGKGNRMYTALELEPEGSEWPAEAIEYPGEETPPTEPPVEPPLPPEPPVEPPQPPAPSATDAVVITGGDVRTSNDLDQASPTWTTEI